MKIILELEFGTKDTAKLREQFGRHVMESLGDLIDEIITDAAIESKVDVQYELRNEP